MKFVDTRRKGRAVINVTPLIDVLFLLVIFVLVTASFENLGGVQIDLPEGEAKDIPQVQTLVLSVTPDYRIFIGEREVKAENLVEELQKEAKKAKESLLVVRADKNMKWGKGMDLISLVQKAKLKRVSFQVKK